ncbi:hypothetical protein Ais01nite_66500 [Asanoa ishikariensis]|uniref:Uncharacterized protein n=1 Tax=Asanoa ishikariensis TaxID=137265 RepID=A0A1H3NHD6_9ACTN|nr:hypothetical protein [Asanoa ishikariensis]GIF68615.1 hypothetical protein Ais01nite_66500 [Asanoa ishikariensis]SDY88292.1 hypothetical protein SAMN05421684_2076 [Asanoa ishikariensis]
MAAPGEVSAAAALPERPVISTPTSELKPAVRAAQQRSVARQPWLGLAGLLFVVPIAVALAFALDGPVRSVVVIGPLVTFSLVPVAVVAFWWNDWPGTALAPRWLSGWLNTLFIVAFGVGLTFLGQLIAGGVDPRGVFDPNPGPGQLPTFPATLPIAGTAFTAMLQFTLVNEGWPLRKLPRVPAGLLAAAVAWGAALLVYYFVVDVHPPPSTGLHSQTGPMSGAALGALTVTIGAWQTWLYVTWRGWPFNLIKRRWLRLLVANGTVILGGWATYTLIHLAVSPGKIIAGAAAFIAAGLVVSMLFENAVRPHITAVMDKWLSVLTVSALATALYVVLTAYARTVDFGRLEPSEFVVHGSLNAVAFSVITHVAVGRRWPFARDLP